VGVNRDHQVVVVISGSDEAVLGWYAIERDNLAPSIRETEPRHRASTTQGRRRRKRDEVTRREREKIKVVRVLATVTTMEVGNKVLLMMAKHCEVHGNEVWIPMQKD
jgi:hypothetical protein